jgi:hypothetical protein
MFSRLDISLGRSVFWLFSTAGYWLMIFLSWWDTRFRIFMWAQVISGWAERKSLSDLIANMSAMEDSVWTRLAGTGTVPFDFMIIPAVMAVLMFFAPFTVRADNRRPIRGYAAVPLTVAMCYISVSLLNIVAAAGINLGLNLRLGTTPGPDFFLYLVHPLYLAYPLFDNFTGFLSQCVYIAFIYSVLSTPGRRRRHEATADDGASSGAIPEYEEETGIDRNSCILETDRLCRILQAKFGQPAFVHRIRNEILDYIDRPSRVERDVELGIPHYRIVLTEARNSLRREIEEHRDNSGARDMMLFVTDEMERMEYITGEDSKTSREWITGTAENTAPENPKDRERTDTDAS